MKLLNVIYKQLTINKISWIIRDILAIYVVLQLREPVQVLFILIIASLPLARVSISDVRQHIILRTILHIVIQWKLLLWVFPIYDGYFWHLSDCMHLSEFYFKHLSEFYCKHLSEFYCKHLSEFSCKHLSDIYIRSILYVF